MAIVGATSEVATLKQALVEAEKLTPTEPPGGRQQRSPLSDEPDQSTGSIRIDNNRSYVDLHNAGSSTTSIPRAPLVVL